jgi:hypothetical protein
MSTIANSVLNTTVDAVDKKDLHRVIVASIAGSVLPQRC